MRNLIKLSLCMYREAVAYFKTKEIAINLCGSGGGKKTINGHDNSIFQIQLSLITGIIYYYNFFYGNIYYNITLSHSISVERNLYMISLTWSKETDSCF